jgi:hypothetical protein
MVTPIIGSSPTQQTQQGHLGTANAERTNTHEYVAGVDTVGVHQFFKPPGYTSAYFKISLQLEDAPAANEYIMFSFMVSHRPVDGPAPVHFYSQTYMFDAGAGLGEWFSVNWAIQGAFLLEAETLECYAIRHGFARVGSPSTLQLHRCLVTVQFADLKTVAKDTGYGTLYGGIYGGSAD